MDFYKESKSEEKTTTFFLSFEGGGVVERRGIPTGKKNNGHSLIFCAHALYKISSSWLKWFSSFNTNKRSNEQVKGITLPMFYGIQSKVILT